MNIWRKIKENSILVGIIVGIVILIFGSMFKPYLDKLTNPSVSLNILRYFAIIIGLIAVVFAVFRFIKWLRSWLRRKILKLIDLDSNLNRELVLTYYLHFHKRAADKGGLEEKTGILASDPDRLRAINTIIEKAEVSEEYANDFVRDTFIILLGRLPNDDELNECARTYLEKCNLNAHGRARTDNAKAAVINFIREQVIHLREIEESEREVKAETEEEKGFWDYVVDNEKCMKDITESMERITKETQKIGEKMQQRTAEVQKIVQSKAPGRSAQVHKIASSTASDMIHYAKKLEEEQPKLHSAWKSFDENTTGLIQTARIHSKEDKDAGLKFRSQMDELQRGIRYALKSMQLYLESIENLKGISRDVNRASKRTANVLNLLVSDLKSADSYCTEVLTLLDEKLEEG